MSQSTNHQSRSKRTVLDVVKASKANGFTAEQTVEAVRQSFRRLRLSDALISEIYRQAKVPKGGAS